TDAGGTVRSSAASATVRYRAPESRYVKPSASATPLATLDLPAPAGPSIATTVIATAVLRRPQSPGRRRRPPPCRPPRLPPATRARRPPRAAPADDRRGRRARRH